jgi:D-tyrosyl-tRNA(Tyr) deacylase
MRALLQRVSEAQVCVDGAVIGQCGAGLMVLICAMQDDTEAQVEKLASKVAKCRIFQDENGKMNQSVAELAAVRW